MRKIPHWLEELNPSESLDVLRDLACSHAREGGAVGQQILRLIEKGDFRALVEFELDYSDPAWSAHAVKHCRQALAFFSKLPDLPIGIDKRAVATRKFLEAEELCKSTNEILIARRKGVLSWPPHIEAIMMIAQRNIARVLGLAPTISRLDLRFGPGATRGVKRSESNIRSKLDEPIQCSEELFPVVAMLLAELPHLTSRHGASEYQRMEEFRNGLLIDDMVSVPVEIVPAKLTFVPKNAKTDRSVCTEAGLNVMFQLGIGAIMTKRLASFGIDIKDQTLNQRRALEGSLTGALATLDLSSASDTISYEIVAELLPLPWFLLLSKGRSSKVQMPNGTVLNQEKFSSMGNGYTFPLETLVFWGLATACCDRDIDVTVYGDDIVLPSDRSELLAEVLHHCGFVVNKSKSYSTGPFRESCGKDYFRGIDVRPFYMKGWVSARLLFVLHNFYVRDLDLDRAKIVEDFIHPHLRIKGPDGYGDGHLLGCHTRLVPDKYRSRGYGGYFFSTFTQKARRDIRPQTPGDFIVPLYTIYRRSVDDSVGFVSAVDKTAADLLVTKYQMGVCSREVTNLLRPRTVSIASLPIGEVTLDSVRVKVLPVPVLDGYKKISIYTLCG